MWVMRDGGSLVTDEREEKANEVGDEDGDAVEARASQPFDLASDEK